MSEATAQMRVYISDPEHPHYGETGVMTGKVITLFGKPMAEVTLDHCRHGTDGCFVSQGQVVDRNRLPVTGGQGGRKRRRSGGSL